MTLSSDIVQMADLDSIVVCAIAGAVLLFIMTAKASMANIPTVGYKGPITSYAGALQYLSGGQEMIQEGYNKFKGSIFKIPRLSGWVVVVTAPKMIEELSKATGNELSQPDAMIELLASKYTLGDIHRDAYQIPVVKHDLTRNLSVLTPQICEEVVNSFARNIPLKAHEWTSVPTLEAATQIAAQVANRAFVGALLCRNRDYLDLNIQFTLDVVQSGEMINMFPSLLQP